MAKPKSQKDKDLTELTGKLKTAKSVVFTDYRGTTVKDMDKFRKGLSKENVFSKVYKLTLVKKAMSAAGISGEIADYKTPVILSVSEEDETTPARIIKALSKDLKTITVLEGIVDGKILGKAEIEALASLPSKDQLRAQFMSVLNGPMAAFVRLLSARAEKISEKIAEAVQAVSAETPAAIPPAPEAAQPAA